MTHHSTLVKLVQAVLCLAVAMTGMDAAAAQKPPRRYEFRSDHDRNGTGKFYLGREIALVMGHQAADWLDRPERDAEEGIVRLVELLPIQPGMVVADVGAGTGTLSLPIARKVGPTGKVLAVDIQPEMLALLQKKCAAAKIDNVERILGTAKSPKLPEGEVDLILMVDVYHELEFPYEMVQEMVQSLKPGGRIAFVEYRLEDPNVPIKRVHKMSQKQVLREMKPHPLRWVGTVDRLPRQHLILFEKTTESKKEGASAAPRNVP